MLNSRKLMYAAALIGLSAASAFGQTCQTTSTPFALRPEGLAELAGDVTLTCSAAVTNVSILITLNADVANTAASATPAVPASANGINGTLNSAIPNSVNFAGVSSTGGGNTITITGLRVNANKLPANTSVTAFIIVTSGATLIPLNPNPTVVGYVLPASFTFTVLGNNTTSTTTGAARSSQDPGSFPICVSTASVSGFFRFTELFASVFRTIGQEGSNATNSTQLRIIMGALPAGVAVWVPSGTFTTGGVELTLSAGTSTSTSEPTGSPTLTKTYTAAAGDTSFAGTYQLVNATEVVYSVGTVSDQVNANQLNIPFILRMSGSPSNGVGAVTAQGSLGPTGSSSFPRFVTTGTPVTAFSTTACATSLLFPYVTNDAGFDTGVAISNTTADAPTFSTSNQSGTCTVNYYGVMADGGALPSQAVTSSIAAGRQAVFTLTGGGAGVAPVRAGFSGYLISQCTFQLGHGFAFVSDLGARNLAMGYLALVLGSNSGSRTSGNSIESLNN